MTASPDTLVSSALHRTTICAASVTLALFLLSSSLRAQDQPNFNASAGKFQCTDGAEFPSVDDQYRGVSLVSLEAAPKELPATKPHTFGPFAPDAMSVEFYQFLTGGAQPSIATETELHFYVHVLSPKESRWYELQARGGQADKADAPSPDAGDQSENPDQTAKAAASEPADISTPDPAVPLFQVSYSSRWMGANAEGTFGQVMLLDLRTSPPVVAKHLECTWGEGGGVCTAPDSGYGARTSVSCEWNKSDYVCNQRVKLSTGWGERFTDSSYFLLSGKDAYSPPPEAVNAIEYIPDHIDRWKGDGQQFLVPGIGDTDEIFALKQREHDLYLFAARGSSSPLKLTFAGGNSLDARFFLAERPFTDRPPVAVELQPSTASSLTPITYPEADQLREQAAKPAPPPVTTRAAGAPITYKTRKIYGKDSFFVLQVTVKEGDHHVLYWIGLDQRSSPIIADLYRLATDALPYYHCNRFVQEEGAAAYHLVPGASFRAMIEVEPLHITDEEGDFLDEVDGETQPPGKVCTKHVAWDRNKGFVFSENPVCKAATAPRTISISEDGQITTKPGLVPTGH